MGFSRQEYWRIPFPSPGDLSNPEIKPRSISLQADSSPSDPPGKPIFMFKAVEYETGPSGEKRSVCDFEHKVSLSASRVSHHLVLKVIPERL